MTETIVTYTLPYQSSEIDLCERHAATHPGLGAVEHGAHEGACEDCRDERIARASARPADDPPRGA